MRKVILNDNAILSYALKVCQAPSIISSLFPRNVSSPFISCHQQRYQSHGGMPGRPPLPSQPPTGPPPMIQAAAVGGPKAAVARAEEAVARAVAAVGELEAAVAGAQEVVKRREADVAAIYDFLCKKIDGVEKGDRPTSVPPDADTITIFLYSTQIWNSDLIEPAQQRLRDAEQRVRDAEQRVMNAQQLVRDAEQRLRDAEMKKAAPFFDSPADFWDWYNDADIRWNPFVPIPIIPKDDFTFRKSFYDKMSAIVDEYYNNMGQNTDRIKYSRAIVVAGTNGVGKTHMSFAVAPAVEKNAYSLYLGLNHNWELSPSEVDLLTKSPGEGSLSSIIMTRLLIALKSLIDASPDQRHWFSAVCKINKVMQVAEAQEEIIRILKSCQQSLGSTPIFFAVVDELQILDMYVNPGVNHPRLCLRILRKFQKEVFEKVPAVKLIGMATGTNPNTVINDATEGQNVCVSDTHISQEGYNKLADILFEMKSTLLKGAVPMLYPRVRALKECSKSDNNIVERIGGGIERKKIVNIFHCGLENIPMAIADLEVPFIGKSDKNGNYHVLDDYLAMDLIIRNLTTFDLDMKVPKDKFTAFESWCPQIMMAVLALASKEDCRDDVIRHNPWVKNFCKEPKFEHFISFDPSDTACNLFPFADRNHTAEKSSKTGIHNEFDKFVMKCQKEEGTLGVFHCGGNAPWDFIFCYWINGIPHFVLEDAKHSSSKQKINIKMKNKLEMLIEALLKKYPNACKNIPAFIISNVNVEVDDAKIFIITPDNCNLGGVSRAFFNYEE